ncbi:MULTISPECIES: TnsD family Tn7-like transposition protein [Calothrix]|uniref:TniQ family protein n=2 Tax=Calothrix TaxID=1186 RepID=A0ABR8AEW9_9CYAN|nr:MULTISPECIES: TnsD family Tn7-like transposition protein [Calothrix]MBD2198575.1 TniQ family protein [Calothrix parietina FACHB-288]MBD2226970.1 TniQ family protein [Calothrix anomala FACHB-343]
MLGLFPEPYPDELLYSICARFQNRLQYPSQKSIVVDLFQTKSAIAIFDLPSKLNKLIAGLPPNSGYTVEYFIDNHTLLPFYRPFLPPERLHLIQEDMGGDNGSKIHARLGIVAGIIEMPEHLRFCPLCIEDDRKQFGECYWHRLHQLPGVEVCPIHEVFLENSSVLTHNRRRIYEFISAEQSSQVVSPYRIDSLNPIHKVLLSIAREVDWLLNHCHIVIGLESLHKRYQSLVMRNPQWVTYAGRIRIQELLKAFKNHYPLGVLDRVQCPLDEQIRDHWLAQLVRFPQRVHHPLRHLLLIQFLGYTTKEFFELQEALPPFGLAPWPCLNPVCKHYKKLQVKECQITYNQKNFKPVGTFSCICGFVYCRSGPDRSPEDSFRYSKVKFYGSVWEESLKALWEDSSLTLKQMGHHLGVEFKTVLRQASRLQLNFPRPNTKATATELCPSLQPRKKALNLNKDVIQSSRKKWLKLMRANPGMGRTRLRSKAPAIYSQLYNYDREWLKEHLPSPKTNNGTPDVDWDSRDEQTIETVKEVVQRLKQDKNRPTWISKTAIANSLPHPASAWVKRHLKRLPKTAKVLAELSESREEFAVRRVQWAADYFRQEKIVPQRWQLVRRAGLRPNTRELLLVKEAIATALDSFNQ